MLNRYRIVLLVVAAMVAAAIAVAVLRPQAPPTLAGTGSNARLLPVGQRSPAPEFTGIDAWINSPPLSVSGLRGRVALIDFWTFSCVNCVRTIPHLQALYSAYRSRGFVIIGVHSPEFDFEKMYANVVAAVGRRGVTWPVAVDSEMATWNAYGNQVWPAEYLLDQRGRVTYVNLGEGNYVQTDSAVASLLGASVRPMPSSTSASNQLTPELYVGSARGQLGDGEAYGPMGQPTEYVDPGPPQAHDQVQITGTWSDHGQYLESDTPGHVRLLFRATDVFVVMGSSGGQPLNVSVTLDVAAVPTALSGAAVPASEVSVSRQDLYALLRGITPGYHLIDLTVPAGLQLYTFTFG
ncbi:MAG TPA: redoxin family protein [Candidatus Saccharimonadales bacterium]|nr:redoxin family protein [Candidatus Saccharimonadales bacterium]